MINEDRRCSTRPHRPENASRVYLAHGEFPQTGETIDRNWKDEPHCCHEHLPKRVACRGTTTQEGFEP